MKRLDIPDADFFIFNYEKASLDMFYNVRDNVDWKQETLDIYGKKILVPRLTAWYGKPYSYSGINNSPRDMPDFLKEIMEDLGKITNLNHNSLLLNRYRNGGDSVAFHKDNEKELGSNPFITSLSLGQSRDFHIRHTKTGKLHIVTINHGDCLLMGDNSQLKYAHSIPKDSSAKGERINLTFRTIY